MQMPDGSSFVRASASDADIKKAGNAFQQLVKAKKGLSEEAKASQSNVAAMPDTSN